MKRKTMKPNDLGKISLVEENRKIEINTLLRQVKPKLKEHLLNLELSIHGTPVLLISSITGFGGIRYWFKCPMCSKRVGTIYTHPTSQNLACRGCLNLKYSKSRYKGMM